MCNAGLGLSVASVRPAITYAWRAGGLNARGQKTFLLTVSNYIDTQGRGAHGPDERGLERLFNITSNYITVRLACAKIPNFKQNRKPPDGACKDMCNGWRQMVNIISL